MPKAVIGYSGIAGRCVKWNMGSLETKPKVKLEKIQKSKITHFIFDKKKCYQMVYSLAHHIDVDHHTFLCKQTVIQREIVPGA